MNLILIREIAAEHRFKEVECKSEEWVSFSRPWAHGHIRINFWEKAQIVLLIITKENIKGFKNFRKAFPSHEYNLVYQLFHSPNSFRKNGDKN